MLSARVAPVGPDPGGTDWPASWDSCEGGRDLL